MKDLEEVIVAQSRYYPGVCLTRVRQTMENLIPNTDTTKPISPYLKIIAL
jgi:hypothetical protein